VKLQHPQTGHSGCFDLREKMCLNIWAIFLVVANSVIMKFIGSIVIHDRLVVPDIVGGVAPTVADLIVVQLILGADVDHLVAHGSAPWRNAG
jgi:hypothetical protein